MVVATVIQTNGSVPREVGAQLLVRSNGQMWGTIGGGAGEAKVLTQANTVLHTGVKKQVAIDLSGAPQRAIEGICGGYMQVWLERWQGEQAMALAHRIQDQLTQGRALSLKIPLSQDRFPTVELTPVGGTPTLYLDAAAPAFLRPLSPLPTLLVVGAGHCGIQLAAMAHQIGFQVVVQDGRPEWANATNFPHATRIFNQTIAEAVEALEPHTCLYAALVTRGFDYDLPALKALLGRPLPCHYIGMIGSHKRVRKALSALQAEPIGQDRVKAIYAPIGLDIGALTPEEIAVSICAELILVRRGGTGRPLSTAPKT